MPQFFASIIAGLRFPGKSRRIGGMRGSVRRGGWVWWWCAAERLQTGLMGWERVGRHSGTSALLGRGAGGLRGTTGKCGECEAGWLGAMVCGGEVTYRLGGVGRECGAVLWHACNPGEGGFWRTPGNWGMRGSVSRVGWGRWCAVERLHTGLVGWERVRSGRRGERNRAEGCIPPSGIKKAPSSEGAFAARLF